MHTEVLSNPHNGRKTTEIALLLRNRKLQQSEFGSGLTGARFIVHGAEFKQLTYPISQSIADGGRKLEGASTRRGKIMRNAS